MIERSVFGTRWGASITTGGVTRHTFRDLDLLPAYRPELESPEARGKGLEIPGLDGRLWTTDWLTGGPVYDQREGRLTYYLTGPERRRYQARTRLMELWHQKDAWIVLDEEPDLAWHGTITVEAPDQKRARDRQEAGEEIVISGLFDPYRRDVFASDDDWLWDPFSFETGIIRGYKNLLIDGETTVTVISSPLGGTPSISTDTAMSLTVDGTVWSLPAGTTVPPGLELPRAFAEIPFVFYGHGAVTIHFDTGRL